ncbi:MAG: 3-deoxy-7-phosphoheptulonate synthase [Lentisphaerae bacterium]|nr:3-deoxy-7-phosphoheptulonate synthase [Lentisphaerota bacterium]
MSSKVNNLNIAKQYPLPTPQEILEELPTTFVSEDTVFRFRQDVENIIQRRDPRILVITGPCSIDSLPAALEYASALRNLQDKVASKMLLVMRTYFEKPRTTIGWKGMIYDPDLNQSFNIEKGVRMARKLLLEITRMELPAATEFLEPIIPQYYADLISWAAIGARTVESQTHRQLASGLSMPVGFKNATDGSINVAVEAIQTARAQHSFLGVINDGRTGVFQTRGNRNCHVILRGGQHLPNFSSEHVAYTVELMKRLKLVPSVMIDCSPANSMRDPLKQPKILENVVAQIRSGQTAICGVMLESYLKTGKQDIATKGKIFPGISVTDACLGWQETEEAILAAFEQLP